MIGMDEEDRRREAFLLYERLCDYWHDVDTNWGRNAASFYTADALFWTRKTSYEGRERIAEFYRWREQQGPRVAVHLINNFRARFENAEHATATWYLTLFACNGEPILPTAPPILVALMNDRYRHDSSQGWLCCYRSFETWFEGGVPATNPVLGRDGPE